MGIKAVTYSNESDAAKAIAEALTALGYSGVVYGGQYVTLPSPSGVYKSRYGWQVSSVNSSRTYVRPILADSHSQGSNPSGVVRFSGHNSCELYLGYGLVVVGSGSGSVALVNMSGGYSAYSVVFEVKSPVSGDVIGLYQRCSGSSGYAVSDGFADDGGVDYGSISIPAAYPVYGDKFYLLPVFAGAGGANAGVGVNVYGAGGQSGTRAVSPMVAVGSDIYVRVGDLYVRVV